MDHEVVGSNPHNLSLLCFISIGVVRLWIRTTLTSLFQFQLKVDLAKHCPFSFQAFRSCVRFLRLTQKPQTSDPQQDSYFIGIREFEVMGFHQQTQPVCVNQVLRQDHPDRRLIIDLLWSFFILLSYFQFNCWKSRIRLPDIEQGSLQQSIQ